MIKYIELQVLVSPGENGRFNVRVDADGRQGEGELSLPFELNDFVGVVHGLKPYVAPGGVEPAASPVPGDALKMGQTLFDAMFNGRARQIFESALQRVENDAGAGVRVRISMDLTKPGMSNVAALPWELMRYGKSPLAASVDTTVVRAFDSDKSGNPADLIAPPLRVLALKSNPPGSVPLDLQKEVDILAKVWADLKVDVDFVAPNQYAIQDALARRDYHVVHYMGHGGFDPESAGGRLLLEDRAGEPLRVLADEFASWLRGEKPLRLVFLNACDSGRTAERGEVPVFSGVADALIREGIPAVVGNQFKVNDASAILFAQVFYERIVQGYPIDAAASWGRMALLNSETPVKWATPVLYMRSRDGELFPRPSADTSASSQPQPPPEPVRAMPEPTNRSVTFHGAVTGSQVNTGDNSTNTFTVTNTTTTTTLPPAESVDIAKVLAELRAIVASMPLEKRDQIVVDGALSTAAALAEAGPEAKADVAEALTQGISVLSKTNAFADEVQKLAPFVREAAGWIGQGVKAVVPLLGLVKLVL